MEAAARFPVVSEETLKTVAGMIAEAEQLVHLVGDGSHSA